MSLQVVHKPHLVLHTSEQMEVVKGLSLEKWLAVVKSHVGVVISHNAVVKPHVSAVKSHVAAATSC